MDGITALPLPLELAHLEEVLQPHDGLDVQHVGRLCIKRDGE